MRYKTLFLNLCFSKNTSLFYKTLKIEKNFFKNKSKKKRKNIMR